MDTRPSKTTMLTRHGLMFVLSAPSGTGKTTIARELLERDSNVQLSVSATTRAQRPKEVEGQDYYFLTEEAFREKKAQDAFLESAEVFGNFYGTPEAPVRAALEQGKDVLFDIDWQGRAQILAKAPQEIVSVFILPPSAQTLQERLETRGQDSTAAIQLRMQKAAGEIGHWKQYDYVIVNEDLQTSVERVQAILEAERLKHVQGLDTLVDTLNQTLLSWQDDRPDDKKH